MLDPGSLVLPAVLAATILLLVLVPPLRLAGGALLAVIGLTLLVVGFSTWARLEPFEKQVALGLATADAESVDADVARQRSRDAGVPIAYGLGALGVGMLLTAWGMPAPRRAPVARGEEPSPGPMGTP